MIMKRTPTEGEIRMANLKHRDITRFLQTRPVLQDSLRRGSVNSLPSDSTSQYDITETLKDQLPLFLERERPSIESPVFQ